MLFFVFLFLFYTTTVSLGSIVPGTQKPYETVMIEGTRDYLIAHQMSFSDIQKKGKWTRLVKFIRVSLELDEVFWAL